MDAGKSYARTLTAGDDRLTFIAEQKKSSVRVFAQYVEREPGEGNKKNVTKRERGAATDHPNMEAAKEAIDKLVAGRVAAGWVLSDARPGFEKKPDAFDLASIPAPRVKAADAAAAAATKAEAKKPGKK